MAFRKCFIALTGHFVYPASDLRQPLADIIGKGNIAWNDTFPLFMLLDCLAQQLLRPTLIALDRQIGFDPFLLSLAVYIAVQYDKILVIFDLQTSCHNNSFPDS